jgi:hypothetical protein
MQRVSAGDADKPFLHMPRDTVPPNKLAGDYIIALVLTLERESLRIIDGTRQSRTKVYRRNDTTYVCPQVDEAPPGGYPWKEVGRKYGRTVYSFTRWDVA